MHLSPQALIAATPFSLHRKSFRGLLLALNLAANVLTKFQKVADLTAELSSLYWLPCHSWADFKILSLTYKTSSSLTALTFSTYMSIQGTWLLKNPNARKKTDTFLLFICIVLNCLLSLCNRSASFFFFFLQICFKVIIKHINFWLQSEENEKFKRHKCFHSSLR